MKVQTEYDFPFAAADTVNVQWLVDTNVLFVDNPIDSFNIYRDAKFDGDFSLNPEQMNGEGSFYFEKSEIQSKYFTFHHTNLTADFS